MDKLPKCEANFVPLTPLTFLKRASKVYANRTSIIYGDRIRFTWKQTFERCCRLASSLQSTMNISKNDVVSVLAPNIPAMYEMHFAVPMAGAVLNTLNTRLNPQSIATILKHSEAKLLFVDYEYLKEARAAIDLLMAEYQNTPSEKMSLQFVIIIDELNSPRGVLPGQIEYEQLVLQGDPFFNPGDISDEWDPIALNYTSGTTSEPKGVVYSHRGAYLSTLSLVLAWGMGTEPVYLWSLPMFHCNGWTFPWGVAARGGTNVCIRNTTAQEIYSNIVQHKVTHMCCAPIVFNILLQAQPHERKTLSATVEVLTGGAPPPPAILHQIERLGFHVVHAYGLTEATGPALVCEWQEKWDNLSESTQADLKARQGISILTLSDFDVKNLDTMKSVPRDGKAMGEIVLRGSSIMKGYLKNDKANSDAFRNGWFVTGDMGVIHPDGYVEIKDRSKDVIISGGENISSVEVEGAIYKHPKILEASVVAMPHPTWGESPCAFVVLKKEGGENNGVSEAEIIGHCRKNLPHYMVPKKVLFIEELPKTNTGKILKSQLRAMAKDLVVSENNRQPRKKSSQVTKDRSRTIGQPENQVFALSRL
ncbi:ligase [Lithospermum erythrorhizon]|uniref:Ligase n=1 Tax=Lithospermum erythrorhizon TaxID=34254 RepID=A0AAV3PVP8_LITER